MKLLQIAFILSATLMGGLANAGDLASADEKALVREANVALAQKNYEAAVAKFTVLAERGIPAAQFNLGAFYLNGQGVQKDTRQAFEWFRKSAVQGNARAMQVIEKAAAQGNAYAINELKIIKGQAASATALPQPQSTPQEIPPVVPPVIIQTERQEKPQAKPQEQTQEKPQVKVQDKPQEKPQMRSGNRAIKNTLIYADPTVAAPGKQVYGIAADLSRYQSTEPLYYPAGGVLSNTTQSYSAFQPGVSAWIGYGDISVMGSFRRRSGSVTATVSGVGTLNKSFSTNEYEFDGRWLIQQFSTAYFTPYALVGIALNSTSGTASEVDFQDTYSQKDTILMLGAGVIIPAGKQIGFRVEGRMGTDKQTSSGNYVANPGVTLSFTSYSYSATATFSRISATMYYKMAGGWNAQLGVRRGSYSAGIGPAYSDVALQTTVGYAFR